MLRADTWIVYSGLYQDMLRHPLWDRTKLLAMK